MKRQITWHIDLTLDYNPSAWRGLLAVAMMLAAVGDLASESVTLTTYYPAPSGVYNQMITTGNTYLARDTSVAGANFGTKVGVGTSAPGALLSVVNYDNSLNNIFQVYPLNLTQGIAMGYNYIREIGSNVNNSLEIDAKGTGNLILGSNIASPSGTNTFAGNVQLSGVGASRGYVYINNVNTGCVQLDQIGDVLGTACAGGNYITSQPGFYIEGWSYYNRGGQVLAQSVGLPASTQIWGLNNCSGGGGVPGSAGCPGTATWMTLKKDDSVMRAFCCPK